jgi:hypothetical protein
VANRPISPSDGIRRPFSKTATELVLRPSFWASDRWVNPKALRRSFKSFPNVTVHFGCDSFSNQHC